MQRSIARDPTQCQSWELGVTKHGLRRRFWNKHHLIGWMNGMGSSHPSTAPSRSDGPGGTPGAAPPARRTLGSGPAWRTADGNGTRTSGTPTARFPRRRR
ncbi:hypothetical protein SETIT_5G408200v2 [Setaria italica]|uniref:Uncharacterized protein n=1 Tax=Setaria italica TaxID=4555 RepID=A0A368RFY3_SETIT|nr:hypothetical protein SETIT_5G408200v2 [Setaria italica]